MSTGQKAEIEAGQRVCVLLLDGTMKAAPPAVPVCITLPVALMWHLSSLRCSTLWKGVCAPRSGTEDGSRTTAISAVHTFVNLSITVESPVLAPPIRGHSPLRVRRVPKCVGIFNT